MILFLFLSFLLVCLVGPLFPPLTSQDRDAINYSTFLATKKFASSIKPAMNN
ncbi:hypothetical protein BDZ91DRAFT_735138 [Kalaharituber pfeilii]|nr:hypothetical protein BDZ91DRAFT_735138 [Kalaharituber pfeilii]